MERSSENPMPLFADPPAPDSSYDAVVVGSGFGGSLAAHRLGEAGLSVCVLERGRPWPPGDFPRSPLAMARNFWDPSAGLRGLYDFWSFSGLDALVASGVGGGSLIYANVLLRKDADWFDDGWPVARAELDPHYARAEELIGASPYPVDSEPWGSTPKTRAFAGAARAAGFDPFHPPLAITWGEETGEPLGRDGLHGRHRQSCRLCGECTIGCNFGAKNTLDLTVLARARASVHAGCEVKRLEPDGRGGWRVTYETAGGDTLRTVSARRVVLAAGSLATSELLLRHRRALGGLGPALGTRFSGNGDLLTFAWKGREDVDPSRGPTITTAIRGTDFYLEDAGVPGLAAWAGQAADAPRTLWRYRRFAWRYARLKLGLPVPTHLSADVSALLGDARRTSNSLPLLAMGRDEPDGRMELRRGRLTVDWRPEGSQAYFTRVREASRALARAMGASHADNPMWRLRRVITVHPLGGAPMGRSVGEGVVDPWGECFGHPGLHIACGAAMPGPVGPNPALTIAAWADRVASRIVERETQAAQGNGPGRDPHDTGSDPL